MVRPKLLNKINIKNDDIIIQIVDWKSYDINYQDDNENDDNDEEDDDEPNNKYKKKNKTLIIRGYGVTSEGNSICIHINGFEPYYYFKIPQDWDNKKFNIFKNNILQFIDKNQANGLIKAEIVNKKEFYGFTNNGLFNYGLFVFKNQSCYYSFLKIMKEKKNRN